MKCIDYGIKPFSNITYLVQHKIQGAGCMPGCQIFKSCQLITMSRKNAGPPWWHSGDGPGPETCSSGKQQGTIPLHTACKHIFPSWAEKTVISPWTPIPGCEAFFQVVMSSCWLRAMTIASSLMSGCSLSHKCVEDGCKDTYVKFGGWKPDRTGVHRLKVTSTEK